MFKKGSCTALLGSNGAGKSTLLLSINGILRPSSGMILFNGEALDYSRHGLEALRKRVGVVFQNPDAQLFSASVYQDISFGLCNLGLLDDDVRERVEAVMKKTGVDALRQRPVHRLSHGQKKRVALAGVLVMEPDLLVLDEPTAGLDPKGASEIMHFIKDLQAHSGITVLIATHDIEMVPVFCDHVCVMDAGKMLLQGSPDDVFACRELLRNVGLRLPRIGHLMEILEEKEGFALSGAAFYSWCCQTGVGRIEKQLMRNNGMSVKNGKVYLVGAGPGESRSSHYKGKGMSL